MRYFSFLGNGHKATTKQRTSIRLSVELLEDRRVLATFWVGNSTGADFFYLQEALASVATGDTLAIESSGARLGVTPAGTSFGTTAADATGAMTAGTSTTVTLAAAPASNPKPGDVVTFTSNPIEQLVVNAYDSTSFTISLTTAARFNHASGDTVTATGDLGIWKQITITNHKYDWDPRYGSRGSITLDNLSTDGNLIIGGGINGVTISHVNLNNLTIDESSTGDTITDVTATTITDNPYTNATYPSTKGGLNTISSSTITGSIVIHGNTTGTVTNDVITGNTVTGLVQLFNADGTTVSANTINGGVDIEGGAGTTISLTGNKITGTTGNVTANGNGTVTAGVVVVQPTPAKTPVTKVNVTISGNTLSTGNGTAVALSLDTLDQTAGQNFTATIAGNDFHNNKIGVAILGDNQGRDTSAGNIIVTRNNFKSFSAGSPTSFAVSLTGTGTGAGKPTVTATGNYFSNSIIDESKVVQDSGNGSGSGTVTVDATPVSSSETAINSIYFDILGRAADPGGLAYWSGQSLRDTALGILYSPEANGRLVDNYYQKLLGRSSDAEGRAFWVNLLTSGATYETVLTGFFSSREFYDHSMILYKGPLYYPPVDLTCVAAIYQLLLGRTADPSGLAYWSPLLQIPQYPPPPYASAGPDSWSAWAAQVADYNRKVALRPTNFANFIVIASTEFRQHFVTQFYGNTTVSALTQLDFPNLLQRTQPPSDAEVSSWVNSTMDLRSIEATFLSSPEFLANG